MAGNVRVIPATLARFGSKPLAETNKRRVAAYARVSTDADEQLTSYEAQVDYYNNYIKERKDWEFVEVYADEGISGTHMNRRTGFKKMIDDALVHKKIDLILTKSISRFARNTVDSLTTIRELKANGVEVFFEKENIWTFDSKGEMLITIMSSIAQEESRSISENVLWGIHKRFEDGKYSVGYSSFLGYDKGPNGKLVINPVQAETVRYIFRSFLEGKTPYTISRLLMDNGMKTGTGNTKWTSEAVVRILRNEKYCGNAILQKTYKQDLLSKRITNNGEVRKFFVEDGHEGIITKEEYDMAQRELEERASANRQHSAKSIFTGKIFCGRCNEAFGSKVWHSTDKYRTEIWQCNAKFWNKDNKCTLPHLKDKQIKAIYLTALNQLVTDKEPVVARLSGVMQRMEDCTELEKRLAKAEVEMKVSAGIFEDYVQNTVLTEDEVESGRFAELEKRYTTSLGKVETLRNEITDRKRRALAISRFIDEVRQMDKLFDEFREELWTGLCDRVTILEKGKAVVRFRTGLEFEVDY